MANSGQDPDDEFDDDEDDEDQEHAETTARFVANYMNRFRGVPGSLPILSPEVRKKPVEVKKEVETPVPTNSQPLAVPSKPPVSVTPTTSAKPVVRKETVARASEESGPKRYPGSIRLFLSFFVFIPLVIAIGVLSAKYSLFKSKPVQEIAQVETNIAAYYPPGTQLVKGCENHFSSDGNMTGSANNVFILGMETGKNVKFAVWEVNTNEVCTNSESLRSVFSRSKVTNEGGDKGANCQIFFERAERNPGKIFSLKVEGGGLKVCTEAFKG